MNLSSIPSLQHISMVKIALCLYSNRDIETMLEEEKKLFPNGNLDTRFCKPWHEHWEQIEKLALEKLHFLPNILRTKVVNLLRPMNQQVWYWRQKHARIEYGGADIPLKNILCWKMEGTVNAEQTAKNIVQNKNINSKFRFFMACTYFMEEEVPKFLDDDDWFDLFFSPCLNSGTHFWMMHTKLLLAVTWHWTQYIESWGTVHNDWDRVSCFFRILSQNARSHYTPSIRFPNSEDLHCCLRQISEQECLQLFESDPLLLSGLLQWPLQVHFLDMVNKLWGHMTVQHFESIVRILFDHCILKGLQDFNYLELFREFWRFSPFSFKDEIKSLPIFQAIRRVLDFNSETETQSLEEVLEASLRLF